MNTLMQKLNSRTGESLIEALAAILVFTLSSILMLTTVSASANINATAKKLQDTNQTQFIALQKGEPEARNGTAIVTFSLDGMQITSATVDIYGGRDQSPYVYYIQGVPGG